MSRREDPRNVGDSMNGIQEAGLGGVQEGHVRLVDRVVEVVLRTVCVQRIRSRYIIESCLPSRLPVRHEHQQSVSRVATVLRVVGFGVAQVAVVEGGVRRRDDCRLA